VKDGHIVVVMATSPPFDDDDGLDHLRAAMSPASPQGHGQVHQRVADVDPQSRRILEVRD
jgi:hypothetical protein